MEFLEIIGILILLIILLIAAWWWYFTMEVSSAAKTLGADIGQSIQAHWDTPSTLTTPHTAVPATPTGAAASRPTLSAVTGHQEPTASINPHMVGPWMVSTSVGGATPAPRPVCIASDGTITDTTGAHHGILTAPSSSQIVLTIGGQAHTGHPSGADLVFPVSAAMTITLTKTGATHTCA